MWLRGRALDILKPVHPSQAQSPTRGWGKGDRVGREREEVMEMGKLEAEEREEGRT